jgi:predicted CoA-binding protein
MPGEMLSRRVWCVVGDVLNLSKVASRLGPRLARNGKQVFYVNPKAPASAITDNLKNSIADIPVPIDVVNLIIHPAVGKAIVEEAAALGVTNLFIQPGAQSTEILDFCASSNIKVFQGCVLNCSEPFTNTK